MLGEQYPAFLNALGQPPPVSIRLHPLKNHCGFDQCEQIPWHPQGRYLPERPVFTLDPAFHGGAYYVQEASSMFLYEALRQTLDPEKKIKVLDICAAPGGKTTLLTSAISQESFLLANEVIQSRIPALRTNVEKWGYPNVAVSNHDPADFQALAGFFDLVVVDAPCSGEGLFRKDGAAISEWSEKNTELCAARQRRILTEAKHLVRPGGVLIYSTCTFNPEENETNVQWLIETGGFQSVRLKVEPRWGINEMGTGYQFFPHKIRGEGFFIACLQKISGDEPARSKTGGLLSWQRLGRKEISILSDWLETPERFEFFVKPTGDIVAIPVEIVRETGVIANTLKKRSVGLIIGSLKNRDFVPSHTLALSNMISSSLPGYELDLGQALLFLKKENFQLPDARKGWALAKYEGLNLGWMKVLENRVNNYLPNEWRIRMEIG